MRSRMAKRSVKRSVRKSKRSKRWVQNVTSKLSHPGALSHKAERAKMSTTDFAHTVLKNPSK